MLFGHLSWDLTGYYWRLSVIQQLDSGACQNNTFIFHDFIKQEKRRKGKSRQHQESSQGVSFRVPCWIISPFIHKMAIKAQEESGSTEISTKPTLCLSTEYQSPYYFAFRYQTINIWSSELLFITQTMEELWDWNSHVSLWKGRETYRETYKETIHFYTHTHWYHKHHYKLS